MAWEEPFRGGGLLLVVQNRWVYRVGAAPARSERWVYSGTLLLTVQKGGCTVVRCF